MGTVYIIKKVLEHAVSLRDSIKRISSRKENEDFSESVKRKKPTVREVGEEVFPGNFDALKMS